MTKIRTYPRNEFKHINYANLTREDKIAFINGDAIRYEIGFCYHENPKAELVISVNGYFFLKEKGVWYNVGARQKSTKMVKENNWDEYYLDEIRYWEHKIRENKLKRIVKNV